MYVTKDIFQLASWKRRDKKSLFRQYLCQDSSLAYQYIAILLMKNIGWNIWLPYWLWYGTYTLGCTSGEIWTQILVPGYVFSSLPLCQYRPRKKCTWLHFSVNTSDVVYNWPQFIALYSIILQFTLHISSNENSFSPSARDRRVVNDSVVNGGQNLLINCKTNVLFFYQLEWFEARQNFRQNV